MKEILDRFFELLAASVIVSGIIAVALVSTACYLWASGKAVPDQLYVVLGIVVGFFFGQRGEANRQRSARAGG